MELDNVFYSRHSIRDYRPKDVSHNLIGSLIDAACKAPSSGNVQNWRFFIVRDKQKRNKIATACLKQYWMNQAPVHIVICYDNDNIKVLYPKLYQEFSIQNISIAATYMILKATELKLGTCWTSVFDKQAISKALKMPPNLTPTIIITVGYPEGDYKKTKRNNPEDNCYFEEFGYAKRKETSTVFPLEKPMAKLSEKLKRLRK